MAAEDETDSALADRVRVHVATVQRTREKFVIGGLDFALKDEPHPPKPQKLDEKQEAFLIARLVLIRQKGECVGQCND